LFGSRKEAKNRKE